MGDFDTIHTTTTTKLLGYDFYREILHSPRYIVAPMVDQSEYAWRILSRKYGAQLTYTPMFNARLFATSEKYRLENFLTGDDETTGKVPLIVQFCANDPDHLLQAARLVEDKCAAIDINLGCPQHIAKRGHYGSFLMEEWELIESMIKTLATNLSIPVTCKIRIFPDVEKTIQYAKMIQDAGASILTVHGRLREQKGHNTGLADWLQIKRVKEALSIPVFANGNILYKEDIDRCIEVTGCDGVMTAEGNLYNPAIFTGLHLPVWEIAQDFLDICCSVPESSNSSSIRAHLFRIYSPCLSLHTDLREKLATSSSIPQFYEINDTLRIRYESVANRRGASNFTRCIPPFSKTNPCLKDLPVWVVQPYIRKPLVPNSRKIAAAAAAAVLKGNVDVITGDIASTANAATAATAVVEQGSDTSNPPDADKENNVKGEDKDHPATTTSNEKKRKRVADAIAKKAAKQQRLENVCAECSNIKSASCEYGLCKPCCSIKYKYLKTGQIKGKFCPTHHKLALKKHQNDASKLLASAVNPSSTNNITVPTNSNKCILL